MRYNVTFNQKELIEYNEKNPSNSIDLIDAIILQQLWHLSNWDQNEKESFNGKEFFWAAYGKILTELPGIGFSTEKHIKDKNGGISKRMRDKLVKKGLEELHVKRSDNSKTFWRFTKIGLKIATPGRMDESTRTNGRDTPGRTNGTPPDERTDNYNSIDNEFKDEREMLSHTDFLKSFNTKQWQVWEKETRPNIYDYSGFVKAFNNDMIGEGVKKNDKLINRFIKYSRHWIKNQKESERPQPKPNYLGVIR